MPEVLRSESAARYAIAMMHKGFRITARNTIVRGGVKGLVISIDGHVLDVRSDRNREAAIAKAIPYVDASIERPGAYTWTRDLTAAQLARRAAA